MTAALGWWLIFGFHAFIAFASFVALVRNGPEPTYVPGERQKWRAFGFIVSGSIMLIRLTPTGAKS